MRIADSTSSSTPPPALNPPAPLAGETPLLVDEQRDLPRPVTIRAGFLQAGANGVEQFRGADRHDEHPAERRREDFRERLFPGERARHKDAGDAELVPD